MERYEEYKDSGVEWIGEIPVGWEMKKIRQFTNILTGSTPKSTEERYWNGDIFWVTTDDLGKLKTKYIIDTRRRLSEDGFEKSGARLAPKGSIVLSTRAPIGHLGILKVEACSNQGCKTLVSNDKYDSEFVYYFLDAEKNFLNSLGTGTTFLELPTQSLKDNLVALPNNIQEQTAIANFLDRKTAEIDALIAQKERLLELYEEEKTAIVNQAVTKGIDPNVELKDSGVEWIGEIPVGWDVKKIKHRCYVKGRIGWKGLKSSEFLLAGFSYLVTGTDFKGGKVDWKDCYQIDKDRYEEDPYIQLHEHDLLITKDGTIGKLAIIDELDKPACLNSGIFVVRSLDRDFATRYLYWVLMSNVFTQFNNYTSYGSTIRHLYQNVFVEFSFGFPTPEEQTCHRQLS